MMKVKGAEEAAKVAAKYLSPRYWRLDALERYVAGTQYDGRADWFAGVDKPLLERAPCVNYPIAAIAIESNVDLCLGEGRYPTLTTYASEDDEDHDPEFGLDEDDSETFDKFLHRLQDQASLRTVAREALEAAQATGTAVTVCSVQRGRVVAQLVRAKWCSPTFDHAHPDVVAKLEVRYPYTETFRTPDGWAQRCMLYRRVIDAERDVVYQPAPARDDGAEPVWTEDPVKSTTHGLGFCPVVWYRHLPPCSTVGEIDGRAIHDGLLSLIDGLNFGLSQRHRAALYATDPQFVEIGVDVDANPAPTGQTPRVIVKDDRGGVFGLEGGGPARRKGPGIVWRYENPAAKVEMLTLPGDALKATDDNCKDLRDKLCESLGVVLSDPNSMRHAAALSGKALAILHARQTARVDKIRDDFGEHWLLAVVDMLLRIVHRVRSGIYLGGLADVLPILDRFEREVAHEDGTRAEWMPPRIELLWGDYFPSTSEEDAASVKLAVDARDAGLITSAMALERLRTVFKFGSAAEVLEAVQREKAEATGRMHVESTIPPPNGEQDPADSSYPPPPIPKAPRVPTIDG